jgi:hypothetical protein
MFKAEIGNFLYIIIAIVVMVSGVLEKYIKNKKKEEDQSLPPQPARPYYQDEVEDDDISEEERHTPQPQTFEEMVKRMLQPNEYQRPTVDAVTYPVEAQSLETISGETEEDFFRKNQETVSSVKIEKQEDAAFSDAEFDLRQAVIYSEILRRKY